MAKVDAAGEVPQKTLHDDFRAIVVAKGMLALKGVGKGVARSFRCIRSPANSDLLSWVS